MASLHAGDDFYHLAEPMKIRLPGLEVPDFCPRPNSRPREEDKNSNTLLASQNAAIAIENARLARDNVLLRFESLGMPPMTDYAPMTYGPPGLCNYVQNPWEIPVAPRIGLHPQWCQEDDVVFAQKLQGRCAPKMGNGQRGLVSKRDSISCATESTNSGDVSLLHSSDGSENGELGALASTPSHMRTTVMIRNLPNNLDREGLLQLVNDHGFEGTYNLLYLPIDFKSKAGLGYAFIDFQTNKAAEMFFQKFHGFNEWTMSSDKVCDVTWSVALQGIEEHVKRYRNSPVMHESVAEEYRPLLFKDGKRVQFPEPTKRIRAPRQWPRRH